jgi:DNA-binding CsgD family transcriptional regulator
MDQDPFARLTDKQRACLRLVLMHRSSKEIARELGIGADAVDQRIKTAMRVLAAESRVEAARLLAEHEGHPAYQRPVYQTPDVVPDAAPGMFIPTANEGARGNREPAGLAVREEQAAFMPLPWQTRGAIAFPLPLEGGERNGLGPWQRVGWIAAIAIGTAIGFGAFLSGLQALSQLVRSAH